MSGLTSLQQIEPYSALTSFADVKSTVFLRVLNLL
jgi:hypothetical protein